MLDDTQRKSITSHAFALHDFLTRVGCSQGTASRAVETGARTLGRIISHGLRKRTLPARCEKQASLNTAAQADNGYDRDQRISLRQTKTPRSSGF
jgi:hypothetical protein